ncbi:MAG TPA: hypothetical protein VGO96_08605 [Pyrinomonadaceae bacterium]|jgi:hypothetical protein|nr:hypothetical protein [Pyrinomonadaceae bacterium]
MNIRLSRRHDSTLVVVLVSFMLLCALLTSGCGTSRKETEAYQKSVTAVDEGGAIRTLRLITTAQASFVATHGEYGSFEDLSSGGMLDGRFASHQPEQGGYVFTMRLSPSSGSEGPKFAVNADPKTPASGIQTNGRHFYLDASGTIHVNSSQPATESDQMLQ